MPNIEDLRSISLQSVIYNDNEADIIDESEADTEISEDEDAVISGDDQEGDSSDIDWNKYCCYFILNAVTEIGTNIIIIK